MRKCKTCGEIFVTDIAEQHVCDDCERATFERQTELVVPIHDEAREERQQLIERTQDWETVAKMLASRVIALCSEIEQHNEQRPSFAQDSSEALHIIELQLCEQEHILLKPNQLYRFTVDATCEKCRAIAAACTHRLSNSEVRSE